ncbi:MAG TPA: hypothetical protein VG537_02260 [Candidatus Kapabacteria bacterium]|nr:hypothetical protein [Candidatus Kapabacteria bacterium]
MRSNEADFISNARKKLAELALFFFLISVAPAVYAMSQVERREINRAPIVQMESFRRRQRALERRYGMYASIFVMQMQ